MTKAEALKIRKAILSVERYSSVYGAQQRTMSFYSCDGTATSYNNETGKETIIECDYSIWFGSAKKWGCSDNILVKASDEDIELFEGLTLCH